MNQTISTSAEANFQPAYVRALKTWNALAGVVIASIWIEAYLTNTLTQYLAFAAPIFGPGFIATALYVHFRPQDARRGARVGFLFFAGYFMLAYVFALIKGPWEYSYLIFSNAVWTSTIYLYASLFLGGNAFRVNLVNATITSALTIGCAIRFTMVELPPLTEQYGIQPYIYSLLAQWAMLLGAQVINELYRAVRSSERQVAYLRQVVAEMVGHEIGTPLQSMVNNLGLLHMLIRRIPGAESAPDTLAKSDKAISNLQRSVEQIERVLSNADASSKSEIKASTPADLDEVDLPHLIDSVLEDFRPRASALNITLHHDRNHSLPYCVILDKTRVTQILTNLVSNALKYTDSGEVVLRCSSPQKGEVEFTVSDTGIGIPDDAVHHIFEPYVRLPEAKRRATTGSGLGLAVVKRELAVLNGRIRVSSVHGKGSTFTVTIPADIKSFIAKPTAYKPKVLVVDDSLESLTAATALLEHSNFECLTAADGGEALTMLARESFDIVFLDIQMPIADGFEVIKRVRTDKAYSANATTPIIGMSANTPAGAELVLFNFFLRKPFTFDANLVNRFIVRSEAPDASPAPFPTRSPVQVVRH